jgi:hypothetical protein
MYKLSRRRRHGAIESIKSRQETRRSSVPKNGIIVTDLCAIDVYTLNHQKAEPAAPSSVFFFVAFVVPWKSSTFHVATVCIVAAFVSRVPL